MVGPSKAPLKQVEASESSDKNSETSKGTNALGNFDGNRDPADARRQLGPDEKRREGKLKQIKLLDIGLLGSAWATELNGPVGVKRPAAPNPGIKKVTVNLNAFKIDSFPKIALYQYDIKVIAYDSGKDGKNVISEKRPVLRKVWNSKKREQKLEGEWMYDGSRIAWSEKQVPSTSFEVNLDDEQGRTPNAQSPDKNKFRLEITPTAKVDFTAIDAYMKGQTDKSDAAIAALTVLDHLIRHGPSSRMSAIKRNFYSKSPDAARKDYPNGICGMKGAYAAVKLVNNGDSAPGPTINVDVANGTFYQEKTVDKLLLDIAGMRSMDELAQKLVGKNTMAWEAAKKLKRLHVTTNHSQKGPQEYTVDGLTYLPNEPKGKKTVATSKNWPIVVKQNGVETRTTPEEYFKNKYNRTLRYPNLPVLQMVGGDDSKPHRKTVVPMELCTPEVNARYPYKINDRQMSAMIKETVTPPTTRWADIVTQYEALNFQNDRMLKHFGLQISTRPTQSTSTVLSPPAVVFGGNKTATPQYSGRWDLRGQRFYQANTKPLKNWSVTVLDPSSRPDTYQKFIDVLIRTMKQHGMKVVNERPALIVASNQMPPDDIVRKAFIAAGNPPDLVMFVLPDRNAATYHALKHFCDLGVQMVETNPNAIGSGVSQCVQNNQAEKAAPQYCSNLATKINAKLGGTTCIARGTKPVAPGKKTMFIGCDVSHGAPGSKAQSVAAFTVSWDKEFNKYLAVVASNGDRKEMVMTSVINEKLGPLIQQWCAQVGGGTCPDNVFYMRDGVSEGQYSQVVEQEVGPIRDLFRSIGKTEPKITAMICSKRHHVRFFPVNPREGDKNGNPLPGTLVETGVTDPTDWDFYLCAHAAIKGTARPVHYFMLCDEVKLHPAQLQQLIYEHSYQFVRATTPISLHPAIYYAHLAAARGAAHVSREYLQWYQARGEKTHVSKGTLSSETMEPALKPITPAVRSTMWYV